MQSGSIVMRRVRGAVGLLWGVALTLAAGGVAAAGGGTEPAALEGATRVAQAPRCQAPEETAAYRVTFTSTWSAATHPEGFPPDAHFSDLIGATHSAGWVMWAEGGLASPGIEQMAERGKSSPLDREVETAIRAGLAGTWLGGGGIRRSPGSVSLDFRVSRAFSYVSLVSMLAPSPDWFVGVAGLDLCEKQRWLMERTVVLYAYDAGTDSGTVYDAPNADTQPRERITRVEGPPFQVAGEVRPVGTFTFTRR
ncbi:MAG: spondin domain-containing protein [candidate division NC10 bacterium]|nr:spondin domain-containing protein [candidate division NC10 bacterium]